MSPIYIMSKFQNLALTKIKSTVASYLHLLLETNTCLCLSKLRLKKWDFLMHCK